LPYRDVPKSFFSAAALMPSAGIDLHHSPLHINAPRALSWSVQMIKRMKLPRRKFLYLAVGAAAFPVVSRVAWAQTYLTRPVRLIVGFAAGGPTDFVARLMGQSLSERLGQQVIIENRPGAGSSIAAEMVARAPADGYTLLLVSASNFVNATLYDNLTFNFLEDITPVAGLMRQPFVMVVNPSLPAKTVSEFIDYAKAHPDKINMASGGIGSAPHMCGELFKIMADVKMLHVPYRGNAPALTDLIGGQVQVLFDTIPSSIEQIRAGKLRPLAVTTAVRSVALPDIPAVGEFVSGYEASSITGIAVPKNTPAEIVARLNMEINASLADPKMTTRIAELGGTTLPGSPVDFGKLVASEVEKWGKVIRAANIKAQ
jgi:tripartite-type tricarboxylate transporter receptor subunit TctC